MTVGYRKVLLRHQNNKKRILGLQEKIGGKMKLLEDYILQNGRGVGNSIVKVDSFLNHQIDPTLMMEIGLEFKRIFGNLGINKVLTVEASGIAIGVMTAHAMNVPLVFAKKKIPATMEDFYSTKVFSFTKNKEYTICIGKEFLNKDDKILIVDDFLAKGNACLGLMELIKQSGGKVIGIGIAITKGFQDGEKLLLSQKVNLHSLAVIESIENGKIIFRK